MKRKDLLPNDLDSWLAKVTEECGEVLQAIGKLQRFGVVAYDHGTPTEPIIPPNRYENAEDLRREMDDLHESMSELDKHLRRADYEARLERAQGGRE
jgi:NTP pyrophosphatase (non-canonical NTP hydrolase)